MPEEREEIIDEIPIDASVITSAVDGFLRRLSKFELVRDDNSNYVLRGNGTDHYKKLFSHICLNPDTSQLKALAGMVCLFGLFDRQISSFITLPEVGFIASFKHNGEFAGTFISSEEIATKEVMKMISEKKQEDPENTAYYDMVGKIVSTPGQDFLQKTDAVLRINGNEDQETMNKVGIAVAAFKQVNKNNCNENGHILERIVSRRPEIYEDLRTYNARVEAKKEEQGSITEEDKEGIIREITAERQFEGEHESNAHRYTLTKATRTYDNLLNNYILENGYKVYRGTNGVQDQLILNRPARITDLESLITRTCEWKYPDEVVQDVVAIQNICATDYTADAVEQLIDSIGKDQSQMESLSMAVNLPNDLANDISKDAFKANQGVNPMIKK